MIKSFLSGILPGIWLLLVHAPSPEGKPRVYPGQETRTINERIHELSAGDTLLFQPGIYRGPFTLKGVHGRPNLPIVLMGVPGSSDSVTIDGQSMPGTDLFYNAFQLQECSWIVIEGFSMKNCWTDMITAVNVSYLSVKRCEATGGRRFLYATGRKGHHFLVENCRWQQDIRVWTHEDGHSWEELHHGRYRYYNGSIFQGYRISGVFVLRNNQIRNTFNAFRLSPVAEGLMDPLACSNGEIYNNLIINTSDNVFEPELYCHNLYFHHNRLVNGHAFISVTEVGGGPIFLFANTGLSEPDCEDGWAIFKISNHERTMSEPFYIFNNSWYVDYNITGERMGWWNDHVVHFNNAYFFDGIDTFGIKSSGGDSYYDFDCSSALFPDFFTGHGFEACGVEGDPMFRDPVGGDFRVKNTSPCNDKGREYEGLVIDFKGLAPDIGAYEGEGLVNGPAFKFSQPEVEVGFEEHPRITRYHMADKQLVLWFSMPMDHEQFISKKPVVREDDRTIPLRLVSVEDNGYCLRFAAAECMDPAGEPALVFSGWPSGRNGMTLTSWASALRVSVAN
jgi:hypothetical protein